MNYIFEKRLNVSQAYFTRMRMAKAIKEGQSFNRYQRDMMTSGTGYKRLDMLADWNRAKVVERPRRWEERDRATRWYDKIAMPMMKAKKITPTEFMGWTSAGMPSGYITKEEEDEWDEYMDEMREEFEDMYEKRG